MLVFPNAKINLGLRVTGKRDDGYHAIESVFYPIGLCDVLEVMAGDKGAEMNFTMSGQEIPGSSDENLVQKAYRLLKQDHFLPPVRVHLHKAIPMGAGLGGGSSDGVAFLKLLNEKFELNISWGELNQYARQLGSDCSFFTANRPSFVTGRGENCESVPLNLGHYFTCIVHPGIHIGTAEAYRGITIRKPESSLEKLVTELPVKEWKERVKNDFEEHIFRQYPAIKAIKEKLYASGAVYASMSGSGSAVYGIFESSTDLKQSFPGCFVWEGKM